MWTLDELAELFCVSKQTVRLWIVNQRLIEFRLQPVNRFKVNIVVTTDQVMKLLDIKRPVYGSPTKETRNFDYQHQIREKAAMISWANRRAKQAKTKENP